jgi:SAM-dependent methyltransferase
MTGRAAEGSGLMIAAENAEEAEAWDGEDGDQWVEHEERYNAVNRRHGLRLLDAAGIAPDHHVLDIGCGCGESTRDAARLATEGTALGVDLSSQMLARARERSRAEGLTNVRFQQADAQVYPFEDQAFDQAISRFGAMFFGDPVAAFRNIGRALRPSGRLALLAWQGLAENEWLLALRTALAVGRTLPEPPVGEPGPFGLADPAAVRRILTAAGFEAIDLEPVHESIILGADADDAFGFVRSLAMTQRLLNGLDAPTAARALEALRATLAAHATAEGVLFDSGAWLITARSGGGRR